MRLGSGLTYAPIAIRAIVQVPQPSCGITLGCLADGALQQLQENVWSRQGRFLAVPERAGALLWPQTSQQRPRRAAAAHVWGVSQNKRPPLARRPQCSPFGCGLLDYKKRCGSALSDAVVTAPRCWDAGDWLPLSLLYRHGTSTPEPISRPACRRRRPRPRVFPCTAPAHGQRAWLRRARCSDNGTLRR